MPAKGLPLPLVSAGGSDVLLTMLLIGLLLNVAKEGGFRQSSLQEVRR
jgi:cell division protein FtsW